MGQILPCLRHIRVAISYRAGNCAPSLFWRALKEVQAPVPYLPPGCNVLAELLSVSNRQATQRKRAQEDSSFSSRAVAAL